jgi:hypothetical protein
MHVSKGEKSVWTFGMEVAMQFGFKCRIQLGNGFEPTESEMNTDGSTCPKIYFRASSSERC